VEDVAEAIARALQRTQAHAVTFECGGPRVYSYEELLRALAREADVKRILIPLPFAAWRALAWTAELLPNPPVTRNQVELMQVDNVCSPGVARICRTWNFAALGGKYARADVAESLGRPAGRKRGSRELETTAAAARSDNARLIPALWDRIGTILDTVTPEECNNYFRHAGYGSN